MIGRVLVVIALVALVALVAGPATAEPVRKPACKDPPAHPRTPRVITDVDWCNYSFGTFKGSMRAGRSRVHLYRSLGQAHDTLLASLLGVVYGDLDGDRKPEAAIVIEKTTWIAGRNEASTGTSVYVYTFSRGKPTLLGSAGGGKPVHDITFKRGLLTVTAGDPKQTSRYRLGKDDLVLVPP